MSGGSISSQSHPNRRWMRFVDGENLAIQGAKFLRENFCGADLKELNNAWYEPPYFLWFPANGWTATTNYNLASHCIGAQSRRNSQAPEAVRAYYYTMVTGTREEVVPNTEDKLWKLGFNPKVGWKSNQATKCRKVDSWLSVDMLGAAHKDQFDVVEIWTGDADYIHLVKAVKLLGKVVICCFFEEKYGLSGDLKVTCDQYCSISPLMLKRWESKLGKVTA